MNGTLRILHVFVNSRKKIPGKKVPWKNSPEKRSPHVRFPLWGRRMGSIDKNLKNCSIFLGKFSRMLFKGLYYRVPFFTGIFFPRDLFSGDHISGDFFFSYTFYPEDFFFQGTRFHIMHSRIFQVFDVTVSSGDRLISYFKNVEKN